jgi:hypothetical protein
LTDESKLENGNGNLKREMYDAIRYPDTPVPQRLKLLLASLLDTTAKLERIGAVVYDMQIRLVNVERVQKENPSVSYYVRQYPIRVFLAVLLFSVLFSCCYTAAFAPLNISWIREWVFYLLGLNIPMPPGG